MFWRHSGAAELERAKRAVDAMAESAAVARAPFEWADGPLVTAMRQGDIIRIDELNLAEDAVLERLNRYMFSCPSGPDLSAQVCLLCLVPN